MRASGTAGIIEIMNEDLGNECDTRAVIREVALLRVSRDVNRPGCTTSNPRTTRIHLHRCTHCKNKLTLSNTRISERINRSELVLPLVWVNSLRTIPIYALQGRLAADDLLSDRNTSPYFWVRYCGGLSKVLFGNRLIADPILGLVDIIFIGGTVAKAVYHDVRSMIDRMASSNHTFFQLYRDRRSVSHRYRCQTRIVRRATMHPRIVLVGLSH